jgi:hypothetical protein
MTASFLVARARAPPAPVPAGNRICRGSSGHGTAYELPASRYGQALSSVYAQVWLAKYLPHAPDADEALLAPSFDYVEPDAAGSWAPIALDRAERLSSYFCSGHDIATATGRAVDDDIAGVGCE